MVKKVNVLFSNQNSNSVNNIDRLESVFFELLERLRFNWKTTEATQILIALFFLKRFFEIKHESNFKFKIENEDADFFSDLEFNYISNSAETKAKLRTLFINISRNNKDLVNIFHPLTFALEKEDDLKHIIEVLVEMNQLDFSISLFSDSDFGYFFNKILRNLSFKNEMFSCTDFLSNLIANLIVVKENNLVYIPFSGTGNIIKALKLKYGKLNFIAFEKNPNIWAFSKMNLIMNGIFEDILFNSNPLIFSEQNKYLTGSAIGIFPFGMKLETRTVKNRAYIDIPFEVSNSVDVICDSLIRQKLYFYCP